MRSSAAEIMCEVMLEGMLGNLVLTESEYGSTIANPLHAVKLYQDLCLPLICPSGSRRSPEVFVMEPTQAWHLHHPALARRLHTPWLGCVLRQR